MLSLLERTLLRVSTAGSVDDGKSTLLGRLLHDSKCLFQDTIDSVAKQGKDEEIDYSLFTDGLKAEREQKITIDVAYRHLSTPKRQFILADAPGHEQYTRNMVTGASTADAAIILIDAQKGPLVQTRRHTFLLSLLGVQNFIIAINKMDLVNFSEETFKEITQQYVDYVKKIRPPHIYFIPLVAKDGDNVVQRSPRMPWYQGETLIECLEGLQVYNSENQVDFRFPVQLISRPNPSFRGYAGQIASGSLRCGDEVVVLPSLHSARVKAIHTFDGQLDLSQSPQSITLELDKEVDVSIGDMIVRPNNIPQVVTEFEAMIVWMVESPLILNQSFYLKHTTRWERAVVTDLRYEIDINSLRKVKCETLKLNQVGRAQLQVMKPLFLDSYQKNRHTGSFILVDAISHATVGAGVVLDRLTVNSLTHLKKEANQLNVIPVQGHLTREDWEKKLNQKAKTIWLTGLSGVGKSTIAVELEKILFFENRHAVRLDGDNIRHGLCNNLGFTALDRSENIRRTAEVAKLFNDNGVIVIVSLISPFIVDRKIAQNIIGEDRFLEVFVDAHIDVCRKRDPKGFYKKAARGEIKNFTGFASPYEAPSAPDLHLKTDEITIEDAVNKVLALYKKS